MYKKYIKRLLDIIIALLAIIILSPLFIIIYIVLLLTLHRHIIFKQKREGLEKKPFTLYKFRTMIDDTSIPTKDRITRFGRILRNTSLDELPQLFNVLNGTMSLIGPRAFIVGEPLPKDKIDPIRYSVKPGMTGYAQIHGKRHITHADKLKYDFEYAKKVSFKLDVKIFFLTFKVMIQSNN